jgi:hypothetical protein
MILIDQPMPFIIASPAFFPQSPRTTSRIPRRTNMTTYAKPASLILLAAFTAASAAAQQPLPVAPPDPAIAQALTRISPEKIHDDIAKLVSYGNRDTLSSMDTDLPPGTGVTPAADWIFAEFTRISEACGNCLEVRRDDFIEPGTAKSRILQDTRIQNIYAVLKGTDPAQSARRVLVTGHYDSRNADVTNTHDPAPGANDDASGVAVSLESARVLSKLRFPATIVFVAVAGEEQGLNGSRHLAKLARSENWDLEAVLNNDIVGGDTTPGQTGQDKNAVRIFSEGVPAPTATDQLRMIETLGSESDSPSRELARAIGDVDHTYFHTQSSFTAKQPPNCKGFPSPAFHPVLIFRRDRFLRGGDHTSFNAEGFAAVRFTEWQENFDHQHQTPRTAMGTLQNGTQGMIEYGDFLKFVDFNYVANVARLNAASLATFASAPGEPQNVRVLTRSLDNNTELTWQPPAGAPAGTSYEVLWRATDAPNWTNLQSAGSALTLKVPISKDNFIFGVRSSDPSGHKSPAVYPLPQNR